MTPAEIDARLESFNPDSIRPGEIVFQGDQPAYSEDGVDLTLIRWMLSLTPRERLGVLQGHVRSLGRIRRARGQS